MNEKTNALKNNELIEGFETKLSESSIKLENNKRIINNCDEKIKGDFNLLQDLIKKLKDMNSNEQTKDILFAKPQNMYLIKVKVNELKENLENYIKILKDQCDLSIDTLNKMNDYVLD